MLNMNKIVSILLIFFFISGPFAVAVSPVSASELVEDSWTTKTPMTQARTGFGVVAVDGKIYAIGGTTVSNVAVGTNECYDPETDTWVTLKPMPTPRAGFAIATYDDKIYCIGGWYPIYLTLDWWVGPSVTDCNEVEVYDTVTDRWSTKTSFPFSGSSLQAYVISGKIFVIDKFSGDFTIYDPVRNAWNRKATIPYIAPISVSTVVDDKILFFGLFGPEDAGPFQMGVLIYDPSVDVWSRGKSGPNIVGVEAAVAATGVYVPHQVYVLWKQYDTAYLSNSVYDPVKDTWSPANALTPSLVNFGAAVVDDIVYVISGNTSKQYVPIGYHGDLLSDTKFSLNNTTIAVVVLLLISGVTVGLFFYLKNRKKVCI